MTDQTIIAPGSGRRFIGKYLIEGLLGEGAMGQVYAGIDPDIERPVAIKTIHRHLIDAEGSQDWLDRFAREARAAGRVLHPNLVTIFDFLQEDAIPYIVMERVRSTTLEDRHSGEGKMPLEEIHAIMSQILAGLSCIHAAGIVHRDLKPANVMLTDDGGVKVTDFGIARLTAMDATGAGMIGTPAYMAPEQLMGAEVDARADIYAAGVVLYEMLTGRKPYKGGGIEALYTTLRNGKVTPPSEIVTTLCAELDEIVLKAMSIEPDDRFDDADSMRQALANVLPTADRTGLINMAPAARRPRPRGSASSMANRLSSQTLFEVEKQLTSSLGPMGRVIVRRAAERSSSPKELIETVLGEFSDSTERNQVKAAIESVIDADTSQLVPKASIANGLSEDAVQTVLTHLKKHLGPIAKVLVAKAARDASSLEELAETVAAKLDDETERQQFLDAVKRARA
ncbi:serine/threonine protein kinase [Roseibium sp.]|uniref:serine/threonine protein kinase n=1 Tax=Roseibium sp. TaxID=1936156 RepID=UPI003A970B64